MHDAAPSPTVVLAPYGDDPLAVVARRIASDSGNDWPDLSHVVVLLGEVSAAPRLRKLLLAQAPQPPGRRALLGPHITPLRQWLNELSPPVFPVLNNYARELVLTQALLGHVHLYRKGSPWMLTDGLLALFDELTLNEIDIPQDLDPFLTRLKHAYGVTQVNPTALGREAILVHTLWRAWREQLEALHVYDEVTARASQLKNNALLIHPRARIYLAGYPHLSRAEIHWLKHVSAQAPCTVIIQGTPVAGIGPQDYHPAAPVHRLLEHLGGVPCMASPPAPYAQFIDTAYGDMATPLMHRARAFAQRYTCSPASARLFIYPARNAEDEAHAVDLQVRMWLLEGKRNIGIVTENRRLARRVRALLERAGVSAADTAGWALSTTSAAAALERWLETVEEDFAYEPLLDVLKSPFVFPGAGRDAYLATVYRLEQDIIQNENIPRNLARYRLHVRYRRARLPEEMGAAYEAVLKLLERLEHAARPLLSLIGGLQHTPTEFLSALRASTQALGMDTHFAADAAGQRILQELALLELAARDTTLLFTWQEFRAWLGRALERYNFQPPVPASTVFFYNLAQSTLANFDAVIIASCEQEYLSGASARSPFFNDAVRTDLGLPTTSDAQTLAFHHFRRLLECAPQVLATYRREQDGEDVIVSPWLELLSAFHSAAYGDDLTAISLTERVGHPATQVQRGDPVPLPGCSVQPRPPIDPYLLPHSLSANAYQQLMDCPYQFYAAQCLKLAPPETVREALEKSDYGERVHQCLQAFYRQVPGLPEPFAHDRLDDAQRAAAIAHMERIANAVFARDLEDNFQHRGWLKRWLALIPAYIDVQIKEGGDWRVCDVEFKAQREDIVPGLTLKGRLDRVDVQTQKLRIVDYKTGYVPDINDVQSGEAVQLPFYAMLLETANTPVERVEYLILDKDRVGSCVILKGEDLRTLQHAISQRLGNVIEQMIKGSVLPAWGDPITCARCEMQAVCRISTWGEN